jgi:hypothetical protein
MATATLTVTDPTPAQGHEFVVHVRNGTATVGGTAYIAGQTIWRSYHSGAWSNTVLASLGTAQTFSALQTFTAGITASGAAIDHTHSTGITTRAAATQDAIALVGRAGGTSSYVGTLTPTTLTASRTYTLPDAAITVAGSASALTSGRVPFVTTGGLLTDSSGLTFDGTTLSSAKFAASAALANGTYSLDIQGNNAADRTMMRVGVGGISNGMVVRFIQSTGAIEYVFAGGTGSAGSATFSVPVTSTGVVTVPNGTAVAPGLRITGEQSGFYRASSTTLGLTAAGLASVAFGGANGSTFGGYAIFQTPSAAEYASFLCSGTNSYFVLGGSNGTATGGQVRLYGSTHATKPDAVEIAHGATVKFSANATGIGFFAATPVARPSLAAASGTATRTTFDTATVTTQQLAERVKALIDDWRGYGLAA